MVQIEQKYQSSVSTEASFYYFAYGSCMCPVDLKRTFGEKVYPYVVGTAILKDYRLGFYRYSLRRDCGALDIIPEPNSKVEGVLYRLPWRLSDRLDEREDVLSRGYRQEYVDIYSHGKLYRQVRTYVVVEKLFEELAPNDWYFNVVLRGAVTCGLSEEYCWQLFYHMYQLQVKQSSKDITITNKKSTTLNNLASIRLSSPQLPTHALTPEPGLKASSEKWFEYPIQVYPHHTDYGGVVWHGTYLTWMEAARIEYLRSIGIIYAELVGLGCDLPVIELSVRYHLALRLGEAAIVKTHLHEITGTRLNWEQKIQSLDAQRLYVTAKVTLVAIDREKGKIMRQLPPDVKNLLVKLTK